MPRKGHNQQIWTSKTSKPQKTKSKTPKTSKREIIKKYRHPKPQSPPKAKNQDTQNLKGDWNGLEGIGQKWEELEGIGRSQKELGDVARG
jgi:hypothetical protein